MLRTARPLTSTQPSRLRRTLALKASSAQKALPPHSAPYSESGTTTAVWHLLCAVVHPLRFVRSRGPRRWRYGGPPLTFNEQVEAEIRRDWDSE